MSDDYARALELARRKVAGAGLDVTVHGEEISTYALAAERVWRLREELQALGQPVMTTGYRGAHVVHPLIDAIRSAERHLIACDAALTRRRVSRTAPVAPDRRAVLRPVKGVAS